MPLCGKKRFEDFKRLDDIESIKEFVSSLDTGDVLLFRGTGTFPFLTRVVCWSKWDHVGLIIRRPVGSCRARTENTQKKTGAKKQCRLEYCSCDDPNSLTESQLEIFESTYSGVHSYPLIPRLAYRLNKGADTHVAVRRLRNLSRTDEMRWRAERYVFSSGGLAYGLPRSLPSKDEMVEMMKRKMLTEAAKAKAGNDPKIMRPAQRARSREDPNPLSSGENDMLLESVDSERGDVLPGAVPPGPPVSPTNASIERPASATELEISHNQIWVPEVEPDLPDVPHAHCSQVVGAGLQKCGLLGIEVRNDRLQPQSFASDERPIIDNGGATQGSYEREVLLIYPGSQIIPLLHDCHIIVKERVRRLKRENGGALPRTVYFSVHDLQS